MRGSKETMSDFTTDIGRAATWPSPSTVAHLDALLARAPDGYGLVVSGRPKAETKWRRLVPFLVTLDRVDEAAAVVKALGRDCHVYTSVAVFSPDAYARIVAGGKGKRGGAEDVGALVALWADLDVETEGHHAPQGLPLPRTLAAALATLDRVPPPTFVVNTGGGAHAYWLLADPLVVDTPDARTVAAELAGGWVRNLAHNAATRHGLHLDAGVGDLPRVLRVAGTYNPKTEAAPRVSFESVGEWPPGLVDARPWTPGPVYDWRELANLVATQTPPPPPAPRTVRTGNGRGLDILDILDAVPWGEVWPDGWTFVGYETIGGEAVELWRRPGGTSPVSAKCWPSGACQVWSDQLQGLPAGAHSKARVYAWALGYGADLSALSRALVEAGRRAK